MPVRGASGRGSARIAAIILAAGALVPPQPRAGQGFAAAHHCAFWASLASGQ